jgi:hypothetical protein
MKISIDLDGTLWHRQAFFRLFMRAMQKDGHQVGILTSHKVIHEHADRALMRERGFPAPDFYIGRPLDWRGDLACFKAGAILGNNISLHFDDDTVSLIEHLEEDANRVITMPARGREDEHFE